MLKETQTVAQCEGVTLRVAIVHTATEHARITVADIIMQTVFGKIDTSITLPGLGYEDLENLGNSFLAAAKHMRGVVEGETPKAAPPAAEPIRYADNAHLVNMVSNAIGDTLRTYGFKVAMVDEGWIGTMALAEAALIAIDEQVSLGVQGTEALVEAVRSRLQYIVEARMPGVLDMMHWPGAEALADTVCGVALRSRQGL